MFPITSLSRWGGDTARPGEKNSQWEWELWIWIDIFYSNVPLSIQLQARFYCLLQLLGYILTVLQCTHLLPLSVSPFSPEAEEGLCNWKFQKSISIPLASVSKPVVVLAIVAPVNRCLVIWIFIIVGDDNMVVQQKQQTTLSLRPNGTLENKNCHLKRAREWKDLLPFPITP